MDEILSALGTPEMIAALETNLEEKMMSFGAGWLEEKSTMMGKSRGFSPGMPISTVFCAHT